MKAVPTFLRTLVAATGFSCSVAAQGLATTAAAVDSPAPTFGEMLTEQGLLLNGSDGYFSFYLDNDLFAGEDDDYTNGVRISWISHTRTPEQFGRLQNSLRHLIGDGESFSPFRALSGFDDPSKLSYNFGVSLTQLMFTPDSLTARSAPQGERPYAGWLGLGYSLHAKDDDSLTSVGVLVGMIGPAALGEEAQDAIHDLRGFEKFQGWDSQFGNELTFDLLLSRKENFDVLDAGAFSIEGFTEWGGSLGTFRTNAFVGGMVRFGWYLPPAFVDPRLDLNAYSVEPTDGGLSRKGWSFYGLVGARGKLAAWDASLDGPLFRNERNRVTRELFTAQLYAGFGVQVGDWEGTYVHTFQTSEFEEDRDSFNKFGSFALRYRF